MWLNPAFPPAGISIPKTLTVTLLVRSVLRRDVGVLQGLACSDDPAAALFELERYINGIQQAH
jgi:hypothetical protein